MKSFYVVTKQSPTKHSTRGSTVMWRRRQDSAIVSIDAVPYCDTRANRGHPNSAIHLFFFWVKHTTNVVDHNTRTLILMNAYMHSLLLWAPPEGDHNSCTFIPINTHNTHFITMGNSRKLGRHILRMMKSPRMPHSPTNKRIIINAYYMSNLRFESGWVVFIIINLASYSLLR